MKTKLLHLISLSSLVAAAFTAAPTALAADKKTAGPNGGRILAPAGLEPRAEFFVTPDCKVRITFLDAAGKPVAPAAQVVTVIAGERTSPTRLAFAKTPAGDALVSDAALPAGNDFPTVVQIRADAAAKPVTEKFNLNMTACPTCAFAEYACVCEDH